MSNNPDDNEHNTDMDLNQIDNRPPSDDQTPTESEAPVETAPQTEETPEPSSNVPLTDSMHKTTSNRTTWEWITNHKKVAGPLLIIILLFLTAGSATIWLMIKSEESIVHHTSAHNIVISITKNTGANNVQTAVSLIGFVSEILQLWGYTQNISLNITLQDTNANIKSNNPVIMVYEFPKQTAAIFVGTLSLPLMYTGSIAIFSKNSETEPHNNKRITFGTLSDIDDITFQKLETFKTGIIMTYDSISHLLSDFNNHYLDAIVIPYYLFSTIVREIKDTYYKDIPITPIGEEYIRLQVNHNTPNAHLIVSSFNKFITTLLNTGKLRSLMEKWEMEHLFPILVQTIKAEDHLNV